MKRSPMWPSRLIAYWLAWHYRHGSMQVPKFAAAIGARPSSVHNWISLARGNRRGIHERYWESIAAFFNFPTPEELVGASRALYRGTRGDLRRGVPLTQSETPELVQQFLHESAPATTQHLPQLPVQRGRASRITHAK